MIVQKAIVKLVHGVCQAFLVVACLVVAAPSCVDRHEASEADLSAFGQYVYALDSVQLEQSLHELLRADTSSFLADITVRRRYDSTCDSVAYPLWFDRMGVTSDADTLLACLRRQLPLDGLDSSAFFVPQIAADLDVVRQLAFDSLGIDINQLLPRLDYHLSKAYVRYTTGQRYGFMRPEKAFNHLDFKSGGNGYARLFGEEVKAPDYATSLRALTSEERMDYFLASQPAYPIYKVLSERLTHTADTAERAKLAVNLERCRWQMTRPEGAGRHVVVNLPAQQLWAVAPDSVLSMRICCGTTVTKTPLLHSAINVIQVNPDWIIPQTIVRGEVARHAGDSAYFARHRYYIVDRSRGDTLRASRVTTAQLESGRLRVGQRGGVGNSLGRIIFRFPNDFAVYLHDTNNRSAFTRERRTLSHGCIRVEKPMDLVLFLLPDIDEWTADRLRISMDLKPETDRGQEYLSEHKDDARPLRLINSHSVKPQVPVYLIYYTAYPNPATGEVELWPDLYGYDRVVRRHIAPFMIKNK